jgi:uncharacterized protein YukE
MTQAIVDPDEVRRFATLLQEMAAYVHDRKTHVKSSFNELHSVWRDQKYSQFDKVFEESVTRLDQFLRSAQLYADYLKRKAGIVDEYLDSSYRR